MKKKQLILPVFLVLFCSIDLEGSGEIEKDCRRPSNAQPIKAKDCKKERACYRAYPTPSTCPLPELTLATL